MKSKIIHSLLIKWLFKITKVDDSTLSGSSEPRVIHIECTDENPLVTRNLIFASTFVLEGKLHVLTREAFKPEIIFSVCTKS